MLSTESLRGDQRKAGAVENREKVVQQGHYLLVERTDVVKDFNAPK